MRALFVTLAVVLAVAAAATSFVVVDETEHVVITQFGKPIAVHGEAGLYPKAPVPVQRVTRFEKRTLFTETGETELLTADKKNVMVSAYISWRIADPLAYLAAVRTREFAESRLGALVQSALGSALGDVPFTDLVAADAADQADAAAGDGSASESKGLVALEAAVHEAADEVAARDLGIDIVALGITRLGFPSQNLQSVFARMRAERDRIASGYRSEGRAEAQKIRAEADRKRAEIVSSAEADAARLLGDGEAEAARIYGEAYDDHQDLYRFLRTLEAYERVLDEGTTLVLPADAPFLELLTSRVPSAGRMPARPGLRRPVPATSRPPLGSRPGPAAGR